MTKREMNIPRTLYGAENLNVIDNSVYAGFAVARGCNATFNNIEFEVTDPAKDAPAEERPVEKENVSFTFLFLQYVRFQRVSPFL